LDCLGSGHQSILHEKVHAATFLGIEMIPRIEVFDFSSDVCLQIKLHGIESGDVRDA